jgi:tyrosyl-tRNA synthetase
LEKSIDLKMSKSKPDSAIFMTDSEEDVKRKISKAYCPVTEEENPILEYCRYVVFESFKTMKIERPEKFGGDVSFEKYADLAKEYEKRNIHPADLKNSVAFHINKLLDPVRKHFSKGKAKKLFDEVSRFEITR